MPRAIRWAQISLKFSCPPDAAAAYIAAAVALLALDGFTSTEGKGRVKAVRKALGRDWRVQAKGEYLIGSRKAVLGRWPLLPFARYRRVLGATWRNGPHAGLRRFAVMFANLRIRETGQRLRVSVAHAPSHVQVGTRWRDLPDRVRPYWRGMARWGRWLRRVRRTVLQLACMDSNLEQHLRVWRDYLEGELGLPSIFRHQCPTEGTEGHRLIDTAHSNMGVTDVDVVDLDRHPLLDHDLVVFNLHPRVS